MTEKVPTLIELTQPRALTDAERALVVRLAAAAADVPELNEQAAAARVVSVCDCGCASVGLATDGPPVPTAVVMRLSRTARDDYFAVSAAAGAVSVVLHVLSGRVGELEVFAGEGVPATVPDAGDLADVRIE